MRIFMKLCRLVCVAICGAFCIFYIRHSREELTAAQLCQLCAEDKAAISRTLVTLQEKGYVEAGEKKYRAQLKLTVKGEELADQIDGLIEQPTP